MPSDRGAHGAREEAPQARRARSGSGQDIGAELELKRDGVYRAKVYLSQLNRRVRVIDYKGPDLKLLAETLSSLATGHDLSKVFIKALPPDAGAFEEAGFRIEGTIRGYFNGEDCVVVSRFLTDERAESSATPEEQAAVEELAAAPAPDRTFELPPGYDSAVARPGDTEELASLYRRVFESYPFPIFDPAYLRQVMETHVVFRLVRDEKRELVAAASAETAPGLGNAEMTDFATLPSQRGKHLACYLLQELERDLPRRGITNLYTLARSSIYGMNRVFRLLGYDFTGRLIKNCHIGGRFEDMLCWCKRID